MKEGLDQPFNTSFLACSSAALINYEILLHVPLPSPGKVWIDGLNCRYYHHANYDSGRPVFNIHGPAITGCPVSEGRNWSSMPQDTQRKRGSRLASQLVRVDGSNYSSSVVIDFEPCNNAGKQRSSRVLQYAFSSSSRNNIGWFLFTGLQAYSDRYQLHTRYRGRGRFIGRNHFLSDFVKWATGRRRSAKQVGSRLQQLKETCRDNNSKPRQLLFRADRSKWSIFDQFIFL